jgi:hypothetical protein
MPVSLQAYIVNDAAMMEIEAYFGGEVGCFGHHKHILTVSLC